VWQTAAIWQTPGITAGPVVTFDSVASFGGGVGGSGQGWSSFILQPGTYQMQFLADSVQGCGIYFLPFLDNSPVMAWYPSAFNPGSCTGPNLQTVEGSMVGFAILQVGISNSRLEIRTISCCSSGGYPNISFNTGPAYLILTQLQ
jgi:hypothetical protein